MSTAALVTTAKTWKQTKCPLKDEWIKKMWCVYLYTHTHTHTHTLEYYSAIKKNEVSFVGIWMDAEIIILSEVRQRQIP